MTVLEVLTTVVLEVITVDEPVVVITIGEPGTQTKIDRKRSLKRKPEL